MRIPSIHTSWLNGGIIRECSVKINVPPHLVVVSTAVGRANQHVNDGTASIQESFRKGQVSVAGISALNFSFWIGNRLSRHQVQCSWWSYRSAAYVDRFKLGKNVTSMPKSPWQLMVRFYGSYFCWGNVSHFWIGRTTGASIGCTWQHSINVSSTSVCCVGRMLSRSLTLNPFRLYVMDQTSSIRLNYERALPGKVVWNPQESGTDVQAGEPYVEVEAMKMIIPVKASESGTITHDLVRYQQ